MESPGPGHGHRGFLVQRNHESGGIVIVYSVPEECGFGNSATSTFCNRDIFAIPNSASVIQLRPPADKPASTPEPAGTFGSGSRTGWKLTDTGRIFSREGKEAAHGLDLYQNRHTRRSSDTYPRLVPRQAQGRDHCRCDVHRGCHRPAFRRALETSHKMTAKRPRDPNPLGKLIVDIAETHYRTFRGTRPESLPKTGNVFPATTSEPRHGGAGALGLTTFTGGVRGVCSPLARRSLTTG